ncbi:MAG: cell wall hydrolase [Asticcacaulis sp.]|nr:cell wall hydrolase [Asticcacaulis sp.]
MAASSIGLLIGASIGSAYLGGALVHDEAARHTAGRIMQLASVSEDGKIDEADIHRLEAATDSQPVNMTAMTIAMRFSRYAGTNQLAAIRSADDIQGGARIVRASLEVPASPLVEDRPTIAAPLTAAKAFAFKAHTQNDADCLTQAVYYEARGEGIDGMRAVAQVILNRVRHPAYPKSICNVVYQGAYMRTSCQFSFVCDGSMGRPLEGWAWRRAKDVANAALGGYVMSTIGTATNFHTTGVHPAWAGTMDRVTQVGNHVFYQFRGRGSHIGGDGVVVPSDSIPQVVQAAGDAAAPSESDALNAAQVTPIAVAPAQTPVMQPTTVSPTGEARAQLIAAVAKADTTAVKPVQAKAVVTGKSAQEITAEVALNGTGGTH